MQGCCALCYATASHQDLHSRQSRASIASVQAASHPPAIVPSALAVSSMSGPPGFSLASGSMAVTALPCAPLRRCQAWGGASAEMRCGMTAATCSKSALQAAAASYACAAPELGIDRHGVWANEEGGAARRAYSHHRQQLRLRSMHSMKGGRCSAVLAVHGRRQP